MSLEFLFSRRVSSFLSLMIVGLIALVLGTVIIVQSRKLEELQKPLPLYIYGEEK